jgi:plastocyanin
MHAAVLQLAPILGAEKSKVPFYIAGAALVVWALVVSLGLGMRRPDFPPTKAGERGVIAVTVVLMLAAVGAAVITSGGSTKTADTASAATSSATSASPAGSTSSSSPASGGASTTPGPSTSPRASTSPPASTSTTPTATTGTPVPPSSPAAAATTSLQLAASPEGQLSYDTKQLSAKAGKVTITMANMSPLEHNVTVALGSTVEGATPTFKGGSKILTLNLKPGTYTFYCSVPGHRQGGMEGTLTVS